MTSESPPRYTYQQGTEGVWLVYKRQVGFSARRFTTQSEAAAYCARLNALGDDEDDQWQAPPGLTYEQKGGLWVIGGIIVAVVMGLVIVGAIADSGSENESSSRSESSSDSDLGASGSSGSDLGSGASSDGSSAGGLSREERASNACKVIAITDGVDFDECMRAAMNTLE